MKETTGKISFVNHQKEYALIEYEQTGKKKSVKGSISHKMQSQGKGKTAKKIHQYIIGDVVKFKLGTDGKGQMVAKEITFLYNSQLDDLVNKAKTENRFTGYLKIADGKYFIKEINSYLFFPMTFSPWQILPGDEDLNDPVNFYLENLEKKEKITAALFTNHYIPEFHTAVSLYKNKTPIDAEVYRISPHSIYLDVIKDKIKGKLNIDDIEPGIFTKITMGSKVKVRIIHLTKSRIVLETVD